MQPTRSAHSTQPNRSAPSTHPSRSEPSLHSLWRMVRGPFRCLQCREHRWEQYDCDQAGCLRCGAHHKCSSTLTGSQCSLLTTDDASICCTITGFCLPCVRYSADEYMGDTHVLTSGDAAAPKEIDLWNVVHHIVTWFLTGKVTLEIRNVKINKILMRQHSIFTKTVRKHKIETHGRSRICIPEVLATVLHEQKVANCTLASEHLCRVCTDHITRCMTDLNWGRLESKHVRVVVGLLYLMKKGLVYNNAQWLHPVPELTACLPPESVLEKQFGLSMKLVCDTENEVKLALRQRLHML